MPAYISEIEQFTRLEVTETGTVAAAATITNVVFESEIVPEITPYPFHVNRPFLLVIHENKTGLILFMGKMMDLKHRALQGRKITLASRKLIYSIRIV